MERGRPHREYSREMRGDPILQNFTDGVRLRWDERAAEVARPRGASEQRRLRGRAGSSREEEAQSRAVEVTDGRDKEIHKHRLQRGRAGERTRQERELRGLALPPSRELWSSAMAPPRELQRWRRGPWGGAGVGSSSRGGTTAQGVGRRRRGMPSGGGRGSSPRRRAPRMRKRRGTMEAPHA